MLAATADVIGMMFRANKANFHSSSCLALSIGTVSADLTFDRWYRCCVDTAQAQGALCFHALQKQHVNTFDVAYDAGLHTSLLCLLASAA